MRRGLAHDSHNLLMPMRMIQGHTAKADRYVEIALSSVSRAAALTHRLLAFSRHQTLDPKPVGIDGRICGPPVVDILGALGGRDQDQLTVCRLAGRIAAARRIRQCRSSGRVLLGGSLDGLAGGGQVLSCACCGVTATQEWSSSHKQYERQTNGEPLVHVGVLCWCSTPRYKSYAPGGGVHVDRTAEPLNGASVRLKSLRPVPIFVGRPFQTTCCCQRA
jgi:hypothetical protein